VVASANSVDVTTDTTLAAVAVATAVGADTALDSGRGSDVFASPSSCRSDARLSVCAGTAYGLTRNSGTVKKTVDATAAAEIRTRSHF
jgi:hypothetical protein